MSELKLVKITEIEADPNQPRKTFAADKMATLKASIKKYGIANPLVVTKGKNGKYLLEDGERRYRTALSLGLKEVPVMIRSHTNDVDRKIEQFHIQEQHEAWTTSEKAIAIAQFTDQMKMSVDEACTVLGVPKTQINHFMAFYKLMEKEAFKKAEVSILWASSIGRLKRTLKSVYHNQLEEDFDQHEERKIEKAIIHRLADRQIKENSELVKLGDAFRKDPKTIQTFLTTNATAEGLFLKSKAKGAYSLRNLASTARGVVTHGSTWMKNPDVKMDDATLRDVKNAKRIIDELLHYVQD